MINSVYKKMGNLRKRINARLVNKAENFLKYTSRPTYITHKTFGNDYAAIHEIKSALKLNKPIQLDLLNNFDAELLFTDTDSLTYEIKSVSVYE